MDIKLNQEKNHIIHKNSGFHYSRLIKYQDHSGDIRNYQMRDINCFFLSQVAMGSDKLVYRMPNTKVHGLMDFKMVTDQRHMLILVS